MKKFNKYLLNLSLLVGLNTFGAAHAGFQSLHQFPVTHSINGPLKTEPLFGFKNQFAPVGVPGCLIGYPEFRDRCQSVVGGFSFAFDGYTNYQEFKVYVPAGTKFFGVSGYMPQSAQYGVAVKLGSAPVRTASLTEAEYQAAKIAQNRTKDFDKLLAGEERIIVHDGGGAISLSGIARLNSPLATGQWLYFRVLTQNASVAGLGAIYEVNRDQYRAAYNTLNFGNDGDPINGENSPVTPVVGGDAAQITENITTIDLAGNMVVNFKLKRPVTELAATNKTTFWVAGYLPKTSFPFSTDEWFFFKSNGWERLKSTDHPLSVAYKINQDPTAETSFSIPTGMLKKDLELFNIEMHFAYMGADGEFTEMGVVWRKGE